MGPRTHYLVLVGELRLYAIGLEEDVRGMFGASPPVAEHLRGVAQRAFSPPVAAGRSGLLGKLGPILPQGARDPGDLADPARAAGRRGAAGRGVHSAPDRMGATWRLLETLVQATAWGSTRMRLTEAGLNDLDFALARGGVAAAVGLRHLLNTKTGLNLIPVTGLTVGWHRYEKALAMNAAYRSAMPQVKTDEQREMVTGLTVYELDRFVPWAQVAASLGRPVPDLIGFWAH